MAEIEELKIEEPLTDADDELNKAEEVEPGDDTGYSRQQQQLDQERANARRAREELAAMTERYEQVQEEANAKISQLEDRFEQLSQANDEKRASLEAEKQRLEDMDPDMVDASVRKNIASLQKQLAEQAANFARREAEFNKHISALSQKAEALEQERQQSAEDARHKKAVESVLTRVENSLTKMGIKGAAKYRSEAMKLADELVDSGQVKRPTDVIEGVELMEDCYLKVRERHEKKKSPVSSDTGKSGPGTSGSKSGLKPGTLDEVYDQMLKSDDWLKD